MESERPRTNWKYKASDVTMGFSNLLSNYQRRPKPFRRSPHVVGQQNPASARYACDEMQGLLPAPNIEFEDDFDKVKQAPLPGPLGSGVATGVPCPGGKAARPDTCFMTHRYVKQEMAYLARRIDEVGRYFLALESMVGSGALGPVLERCLKELEEVLQATEKLEEVDEVQSFIDAAIRLGFSPSKYKPLQNRLSWLCHGRRHEELRAELSATKVAPSAEDALKLQQLIDDAVRSGIDAVEIQPARLRLQELEQQASNERMLAAACAGDLVAVEESLRFAKGDCNSQQTSFPGFSLWHIAAEQGNLALAQLAESFKSQTVLHDRSGWTALMLAASKHHFGLVCALLDAKADPSARSSDCEMIVDCETNEELRWVKGQLDETERVRCFFEIKQGDATATLDQGDQLLAGEGLLLPTFLRVGGRTALHTALLRPGYESGRIAVLNEILSDDRCGPAGVLVNVQDDIGRSPLWYAARECFVGCARCLIRAGALVSLDSMSSLGATVKFLSGAEDDASAMQRGEDMFRLLLRKGASDSMEEVAQAEAILDLDLSGCQLALDLHEALEEDDDAIERWLEYSQQLQEDYNLRLMTQRPHGKSMASAEEAADFAKDAQEELKELAFGAAHAFGGYVESGPEPSAVRISRLYRQQSRQGWIDPSHDWAAVVGGCEATLIFPKLGDVYQALAHLEQVYSFRIRGVQDNLLSGNSHFTHHDPGDSVTAQTSEGEASTATEELARDVAAKNLAPADVTEEVLFQASNDDRSLAASAAAKGLAAATDVALQQLMSPEELARDVAAKGLAAAADVAYHSLGVEAEEAHSTAAAVAAVGVAAATEVAVRRLSQDSAAKTDVARQLDPMEKVRDASRPSDLGLLAGWERGSLLQDTSIEFVDPVYPDVQLWIDCSGCVCLLRLTTERVHEVVQTELDTGRWILEELANAMRLSLLLPESEDDHEDEILEIMDAAEACLGREHLAQILAIPLQDGWSCTVAGLAAHCGFASILQILIDHGAPISQPLLPPSCAPRGDYSPLSLAIAAQHWDCVSLLVSSGADPFEEGVEELARNPSFPEAFQEKVLDVLTCGRAQRLVDNEALAAMVRSSSPPMQEIQRYLAFGADPNTEGMLHTAAAAGQEALVSILLDFGAQVCGETFDRATGSAKDVVCRRARARLHRAAEAHDVETMIRLVEAGLNPDSMLPARSSLLTYAAVGDGSSPHFDLVAVMLQQKADPNLMDLAGHYPLLCAVESGSVELIEELLAHGADVHVAHEELGTATHMAARSGQVHLLEVLLDAGARCSDCDSDGHDVAMLALKATAEDCVSCIRQRGVLPNHDLALAELFSAVRKGQSEYLEQLLDILVKIYPEIVNCTEDGKCEARSEFPSLLVEAVRQAGIKMMKSLLNAGARLYPQQVTEEPLSGMEHRESAWSIACAVSSELTVELLRNRLPQELLLIAKQHRSSSEMRNMQAEERLGLVAQEKDFLLVDEFGYGALDHALLKHNLELEIWFCSHGARFHQSGQLEVLSECVKTSDYVALERRLRAGADVSVVDLNGRVALDWCIFTGFFESLLWDCVENAMTNESDNEEGGATPSVSSKAATAKTGRSGRSAGRLSLRSRKTATATGGSGMAGRGRPPVPFDPRGNFAPIEELLISYGAKFLQTRSAAACLYEPLLLRDFKTIERRAFAAADCSVDGDAGEGMVHRALDGGGVQAARALILNGADPDVLDAHGQTVLWRAVQGDLHTIIDACLLQNIDLSQGLGKQKDSSVAHLAIEKDRPDLAIQFLTRTSPDTEEKIKPPCVNPDATDSHGRTVLMRAVELKHVDVAKVCLELKCNISLVDRLYRRTALHIAAESNPEMIPLLLEARADMNVTDKRGQTPLVAATASRQAESVDLLKKALLAAGPTPPKIPEQPKQKKKPEPAQLQEEREQEHPEPPRQPKQPKDPDLPKRPRQPEQQKEPEVAHLPAQQREQEQTQQPQQLEEQGADLSQMPEQHLKQEHTEHPEQPQQSEEPKQPDLSQLPEPQRKPEHAEHPEPPRQPKDLDLPKQPRQPEQQKEPEVAHLPAQQREQEHREHPAKVQQLEQQLQPDLSELPEQRQESEPIQPVLPEQPTAASDLSSQQEPGTAQPPSRETEEAQQAKEPEQLQEYSGESGEYEEDFEDASPDSSPRMFG